MMTVFFSKEAQFELTDDEFKAFIGKANNGEKVWIPRLKVFLSNMFIWAGEKPENKDRLPLHDGGYAVKKGGAWIDERSGAKIDLSYYPYLAQGKTKEEYDNAKLLN
jgi:hypothetical protein